MILQSNQASAQNWPFPCSQRLVNMAQPPTISSIRAVRGGAFEEKTKQLSARWHEVNFSPEACDNQPRILALWNYLEQKFNYDTVRVKKHMRKKSVCKQQRGDKQAKSSKHFLSLIMMTTVTKTSNFFSDL